MGVTQELKPCSLAPHLSKACLQKSLEKLAVTGVHEDGGKSFFERPHMQDTRLSNKIRAAV